jgi:hypothetical protein
MEAERVFAMSKNLALPLPNELMVVYGVHAGAGRLLDLAARLALHGQVYLLDCGNRSNMYHVAHALRPLTRDPAAALKNIRLSRAFTCYQVLALLGKVQLFTGIPVLVLDFLSTFLDESVQAGECAFLFEKTLKRVLRVSQFAPVVVSVKPLLAISAERAGLLAQLKERAAHFWEEVPEMAAGIVQPQDSLFEGF